KDALALEHLISDSDLVWSSELCRSVEHVQVRAVVHLFQQTVAEFLDELVFLSHDFGQIRADVARVNTPALSVLRIVCYLGAMNHGFRRNTTCIDASPADVAPLDHGHSPSVISERNR